MVRYISVCGLRVCRFAAISKDALCPSPVKRSPHTIGLAALASGRKKRRSSARAASRFSQLTRRVNLAIATGQRRSPRRPRPRRAFSFRPWLLRRRQRLPRPGLHCRDRRPRGTRTCSPRPWIRRAAGHSRRVGFYELAGEYGNVASRARGAGRRAGSAHSGA
jgi:hypothetical protein